MLVIRRRSGDHPRHPIFDHKVAVQIVGFQA